MKYSSLFSLFIVLDSVVSVQATFSNPSSFFALRKGILRRNLVSLNMNIFDVFSIGESMDEVNPDEAPIEALCPIGSVYDDVRSFAVAERAISFTGEDFDIYESGSPFARVRGAMLHLPGKDKMILFSQQTNQKVAQLDRKLVSMTPTYDIYNGASDKVAWIEKDTIALTDSFSVYKEGSGIGMFKEPAVYRISGDFIDRNFVMKNEKGKTVARVKKDGLFQFDAFNHYQVQVAKGMDAFLVFACTCAIDEDFDEEHKERERKEAAKSEGKGWF